MIPSASLASIPSVAEVEAVSAAIDLYLGDLDELRKNIPSVVDVEEVGLAIQSFFTDFGEVQQLPDIRYIEDLGDTIRDQLGDLDELSSKLAGIEAQLDRIVEKQELVAE